MNLTEAEEKIFDRLKAGKAEMADLVKLTGASRQSVGVRMKYLAAKVAPKGWIIENVGGIGRGNTAIYKMGKKF